MNRQIWEPMFRTLIEMNLNQETLPYHIYVILTCKNFRHLSILKPSENQQRQPTANLPNRSNLMSLAASIPSFFKFFSICLLLALEALFLCWHSTSNDKKELLFSGTADCHQFSRGSKNWYALKINSTIQFCNSDSSFLVVCGTGGSNLSLIPLTLLTSSLVLFFASSSLS